MEKTDLSIRDIELKIKHGNKTLKHKFSLGEVVSIVSYAEEKQVDVVDAIPLLIKAGLGS